MFYKLTVVKQTAGLRPLAPSWSQLVH
jgi:hypothetical protein